MGVTELERKNRDKQWEEQFQPLLDKARGEGKTPTPPEELQKTINELSIQNSDLLDEIRILKKKCFEQRKISEDRIKNLNRKFELANKFIFEYERIIKKLVKQKTNPERTMYQIKNALKKLHFPPQCEERFFYSDYIDSDGDDEDIF